MVTAILLILLLLSTYGSVVIHNEAIQHRPLKEAIPVTIAFLALNGVVIYLAYWIHSLV